MARNITSLGAKESDFLTSLAAKGKTIFTGREVRELLGLSSTPKLLLSRLERKGWVKRLERDRYLLVPLEAGPERLWSEDATLVAMALAPEGALAYWSAIRHWGWTDQLPRTVFVQMMRRRANSIVEALGVTYRFVTVRPIRFFGVIEERADHRTFRVTDREKTVIDILDRIDLSGGSGQVIQTLEEAVEELRWDRLDDYLRRFRSRTVPKRLGFLVEALPLKVPDREHRLAEWQRLIGRGISLLDPGGPALGPIITRWRVRVNVHGLIPESFTSL